MSIKIVMRSFIPILLILSLTACTSVTKTRVTFQPEPNTCEVAEIVRPLSTINVGQCWDERMRTTGTLNGSGKAMADVATDLVAAGAMIGAAGIIANGFRSLQKIKSTTTVSGSIDPVTLEPLQVVIPQIPPIQLLVPQWPGR